MRGLELHSVVLLLLITAAAWIFASKIFKRVYQKLCIFLFIGGYCLWSGVGICFDSVSDVYLIQYALFLVFFILFFKLGDLLTHQKKAKRYKFALTDSTLMACTFVFWIAMLANLVYPENVLPQLLNPTVSSLVGYFQESTSEGVLGYIIRLSVLVTRPMYYTYIFKRLKPWKCVLVILLEVYLSFVITGYIARSEIINRALLIMFILAADRGGRKAQCLAKKKSVNDDKVSFGKYRKVIVIVAIAVICALPALYIYQYARIDMKVGAGVSVFEMVEGLLEIELGFPLLFEKCETFHEPDLFFKFLLYLVTLPVPKSVFGISNILILNYDFSSYVTGLAYGEMGYFVLLSGLLGEGIIFCGPSFAFVFGALLGFICGTILGIYSKYESMRIWVLYVILNIFIMNRGGSQGCVSVLINGSVLFFLLGLFDRIRFVIHKKG